MTKDHEAHVTGQFGPRAQAYVESAVHAQGADLDELEALVRQKAPRRALDIGTGGGHVAYRMAPYAARVTACDLSQEMLGAVRAAAAAKGLANIETVCAPAEQLPFGDADFDFAASRFSAHHWRDFPKGLSEARRVLRTGATAVFMDAYAPASALFDTHVQAIELLRDTSHVRDYAMAEWIEALARAGFRIAQLRSARLRIEFASWIARMKTPEHFARAIRALQEAASAETRAYFAIDADGSYLLDTFLIEAEAA